MVSVVVKIEKLTTTLKPKTGIREIRKNGKNICMSIISRTKKSGVLNES